MKPTSANKTSKSTSHDQDAFVGGTHAALTELRMSIGINKSSLPSLQGGDSLGQ
jgi:hypothetical protein